MVAGSLAFTLTAHAYATPAFIVQAVSSNENTANWVHTIDTVRMEAGHMDSSPTALVSVQVDLEDQTASIQQTAPRDNLDPAEMEVFPSEMAQDASVTSGPFQGPTCSQPIPCDRNMCNGHGYTIGRAGNCSCVCNFGWYGPWCSQQPPCTTGPDLGWCGMHGRPRGFGKNCSCNCTDGYTGTFCETPGYQPNCTTGAYNRRCFNNGKAIGT